jgi:glycosyltransferase involved in cell wall biosynthesis
MRIPRPLRCRRVSRVLMLFEPPDGGVAENAMQLALHLGNHGHEVEVAGPAESIAYPRLDEAGVPVRRLASLRRGYGRPERDAASVRALADLLRAGRHDVLHCHSSKAGVVGRLAAQRVGVPAVYSPHCFAFVGEVSRSRRLFASTVERALGRRTAAIVCSCEAERRRALQHGVAPAERLHRVYYGTPDCDGGSEVNGRLEEMQAAGPLAGAVTVLRRQKRVDVLLEAAPRVWDRLPEARLAVVGDGPERDALQRRASELGLLGDERFAFLSFEAPSARHLRALDVYVLPSAWEAMPIGVLEALACGVPQVATDVEGTGEAVGAPPREPPERQTGRLVSPCDPAALAAAIVDLLEDPERRGELARTSRQRHAERFGLERMVAETAAVYDRALAG